MLLNILRLLLCSVLGFFLCVSRFAPFARTDNGFIALGWLSRDPAHYARYSLQACAAIGGVNLIGLLIVFFARDLGK